MFAFNCKLYFVSKDRKEAGISVLKRRSLSNLFIGVKFIAACGSSNKKLHGQLKMATF